MKGIITKSLSGFYYVQTKDKLFECKARGLFRKDNLKPLVGDYVDIELNKDNTGTIVKIHPRNNYLIRPPISNITQNIVVFSLKEPQVNYRFLNEILVFSEKMKVDIILCLNKVDLLDHDYSCEIEDMFNNVNYPLIYTSTEDDIGIDELYQVLKNNVNVFSGASGVGKSSLLKKILPKQSIEIGALSEKISRGKHTTRHVEIFKLDENTFVADTPGFSNIDISANIDKTKLMDCFPEFREFLGNCKFNSCLHNREPNCAIKDAVENKKISQIRYDFYLDLLVEIQNIKKY